MYLPEKELKKQRTRKADRLLFHPKIRRNRDKEHEYGRMDARAHESKYSIEEWGKKDTVLSAHRQCRWKITWKKCNTHTQTLETTHKTLLNTYLHRTKNSCVCVFVSHFRIHYTCSDRHIINRALNWVMEKHLKCVFNAVFVTAATLLLVLLDFWLTSSVGRCRCYCCISLRISFLLLKNMMLMVKWHERNDRRNKTIIFILT